MQRLNAQASDMIRRLRLELEIDSRKIPEYDRVPIEEFEQWKNSLRAALQSSFGENELVRYDLIWGTLLKKDIKQHKCATTPWINALGRTVLLLEEFGPPQVFNLRQNMPIESDEQYDVFISHASEDKDSIARPLFKELEARQFTVWFDESTLKLGDSLRQRIDLGLGKCRYGVVILSPSFFAKTWPQRELDGLVARETATGEKAILPVWHGVGHKEVLKYSPVLADRLGIASDKGLENVVNSIVDVLA